MPVRRRRDRGDETQGEAFSSQRARTCIKIQSLVNPKNIPEFKWVIVVPLKNAERGKRGDQSSLGNEAERLRRNLEGLKDS